MRHYSVTSLLSKQESQVPKAFTALRIQPSILTPCRQVTSATQRQKFHTDVVNSVRNLVNVVITLCLILFMNDKKKTKGHKGHMRTGQDSWNIFFFRRNIEARSRKNAKLYHNRPGETITPRNFQLKLHDHQIFYVSINLRHRYGISVAEVQTSLAARNEERRL